MRRRLPKGEEKLPFFKISNDYISPNDAERLSLSRKDLIKGGEVQRMNYDLLEKRFEKRVEFGLSEPVGILPFGILTPKQQLNHVRTRDEIGLFLLETERLILEEMVDIMKEDMFGTKE